MKADDMGTYVDDTEELARGRMLEGLTPSQLSAARDLLAGENVFLTGDAGTGKSFLLDRYIEYLDVVKKPKLVMAPTGVAALNIRDGVTIHRAMGVPRGILDAQALQRAPRVLKAADVVIVDEVSMVRIDLFEYVMKRVEDVMTYSNKQVVLCGDFFQLPPVLTDKDRPTFMRLYPKCFKGYCFLSPMWEDFGFRNHVLREIVRQQDPGFQHELDKARRGDSSCLGYFNARSRSSWRYLPDDVPVLCTTNRMAETINAERVKALDARRHVYVGEAEGKIDKGDYAVEPRVELCAGARVMAVANDPDGRYVNGSLGRVVACRRGEVEVMFDKDPVPRVVEVRKWEIVTSRAVETVRDGEKVLTVETETIGSYRQIPLKLAYAFTIHKSQGKTFEKLCVQTTTFEAGQLYVGLSRVKSAENLTVFPKIEPERLRANEDVLAFYESLEAAAPRANISSRVLEWLAGRVEQANKAKGGEPWSADEFLAVADDALRAVAEAVAVGEASFNGHRIKLIEG